MLKSFQVFFELFQTLGSGVWVYLLIILMPGISCRMYNLETKSIFQYNNV